MGMSLQLFKNPEPVAELNFDLESIKRDYAEIAAAQSEVGGIATFRAKVATGGGKNFEIDTGDEDTSTSVPNFSGVIVYNHNCNAYFDEDSSGNTPPVCSSMDAVTGVDTVSGECAFCEQCPRNVFGSSSKGPGKACKNMHRLYIMVEGSAIPLILSLPPTSLKAFRNYRLSTLASKHLKPCEVVTEFSLAPQMSQSGQKYSVVKFKLLGKLDAADAKVARYFNEQMKNAAGKAPEITAEDYDRGGAETDHGTVEE